MYMYIMRKHGPRGPINGIVASRTPCGMPGGDARRVSGGV